MTGDVGILYLGFEAGTCGRVGGPLGKDMTSSSIPNHTKTFVSEGCW